MANFVENLSELLRSQSYEVHAGFMKKKKKDSWIEETAFINVSHRENANNLTLLIAKRMQDFQLHQSCCSWKILYGMDLV